MEAAIKRILPHSTEAEQAVVGAMLMDKDAIMVAAEMLTGEDFYQSAYGMLFDAMVELFQAGKPVDLITLLCERGWRQVRQSRDCQRTRMPHRTVRPKWQV